MSLEHIGIGAFMGRMSRPNRWLRRYSLFFDRFEIIDLDEAMAEQRDGGYGKAETIRECDWLIERGYLARPPGRDVMGDIGLPELGAIDAEIESLLEEMNESHRQHPVRVETEDSYVELPHEVHLAAMERFKLSCEIAALYAQRAAYNIRRSGRALATSLEMPPRARPAGFHTTLDAAGLARFVISDLPVPAQRVPWDEILAFRSDEDSQERLRSLRAWISAAARGGISLAEASDQMNDALTRYRSHLRGAGIAHDVGVWESLVKSGLISSSNEVEAWLARPSAQPFDLTLMSSVDRLAERVAPGRELSYLVKVEEAGL